MEPIDPGSSPPRLSSKEERIWAMLCHLSTFVAVFFLANFIVPLAIWIAKRDESPLIADQGREVLNFQITMFLGYVIAIVCILTVVLIPLAIFLFVVIPIWHIVFTLIGAIKAYDGQYYRYPLTWRLI